MLFRPIMSPAGTVMHLAMNLPAPIHKLRHCVLLTVSASEAPLRRLRLEFHQIFA